MQLGSGKTAAVINVTPLIDVLLVLLITFMLLPYHSKGLPAAAPDPAPDTPSTVADRLDVVLQIKRDRSMEVDSQPVPPDELDSHLRRLFATRPGGVLFIDGARELEFADVASVIDLARGAGVHRIGLITQPQRP